MEVEPKGLDHDLGKVMVRSDAAVFGDPSRGGSRAASISADFTVSRLRSMSMLATSSPESSPQRSPV